MSDFFLVYNKSSILSIVFVASSLFIGCLGVISHRANSLFSLVVVSVLSFLLLMMRSFPAAADYHAYLNMYENISGIDGVFEAYHGDYFFSFLMWVVKTANGGFFLFLVLFFILVISFFY